MLTILNLICNETNLTLIFRLKNGYVLHFIIFRAYLIDFFKAYLFVILKLKVPKPYKNII